jgi:hypothetical protein
MTKSELADLIFEAIPPIQIEGRRIRALLLYDGHIRTIGYHAQELSGHGRAPANVVALRIDQETPLGWQSVFHRQLNPIRATSAHLRSVLRDLLRDGLQQLTETSRDSIPQLPLKQAHT